MAPRRWHSLKVWRRPGASVTPSDDTRMWIVAGSFGSIVLGIVLIPLRTVTAASNLAFVFLAFTIMVAEFGGRSAALATAVMSAISLNFFLTEPYLTLTITKSDDVVAFFALAACGLIAAAFGRRREHWSALADRAGGELDVLKTLVVKLRDGVPLEEVLGDFRRTFGLSAVVLRDADERIVAAVPIGWAPVPIPDTRLAPETLLPADDSRLRFGSRGLRLPAGGGRLSVAGKAGTVSLDVWEGDTQGFGLVEARTLTIAASILAHDVSSRRTG